MSYIPPIDNPRSYEEVVQFFDEMLFNRLKPKAGGKNREDDQKPQALDLTSVGLEEMRKSNALNRIFRCWLQLNWLKDDFSRHFAGCTFRQELAAGYEDLSRGRAMLAVQLEETTPSPYYGTADTRVNKLNRRAVPQYFTEQELDDAGGCFLYGLRQLENGSSDIVAPNFDPEFATYAYRLKKEKEYIEALPSFAMKGRSAEIIYWRIAIEQAAMALIRELEPELGFERSGYLQRDFTAILMGLAGIQKDGETDYISVDQTIGYLWEALSGYDDQLVSYQTIIEAIEIPKFIEELDSQDEMIKHSALVLMLFGYLLDKHFLFPANWYFNALEVVSQDKTTFMQNLAGFYQLCNNRMQPPVSSFDAEKEGIMQKMGLEKVITDPWEIWYNPPTCFRFHNWALEIV